MGDPAAVRILYIDDDPGLCRLVARDFGRHGFATTTAASGAEGVARAAEVAFDAICLDHYMPGEDGLAVLPQLLARPEAPPVVYVTGSEEGRVAIAAMRAGAADYVIKTPSPDFLELLRDAIEGALAREAMRRAKDAAEAAVRAALDRAEELAQSRAVLLREVNHRVANSLQLIASLTRLQENAVSDPVSRGALAEMRNRIAAVAQVHRRLYTSDDVRTVALGEYLDGLLTEIGRSVGGGTIELHATPVTVATDRAVSIGVIVSELVTNAIKYAYPDGASGPIRVRLRTDGDTAVLAVEDDGVGTPAAAPGGTGIGQRIVTALATSLAGTVALVPAARGTHVEVRFALAA